MMSQKKYKLVIFDKDGTLTTTKSGERFVQHPQDQKLLPGIYNRLEQLVIDEVKVAIATNQGGVAAGHKSIDKAKEELAFAIKLCPPAVLIHGFLCPDFEGKSCKHLHLDEDYFTCQEIARCNAFKGLSDFRKPGAGMLLAAMEECEVTDPSKCLMVGDRPEDEQAAKAAGMDFEWA